MRRAAVHRRAIAAVALAMAITACGGPPPVASPSGVPSASTLPGTSQAPTEQASIGAVLPSAPGQPYDAESILAAMRDSRRPGGVPDVIETDTVASAIAEAIWTIDGGPWDDLAIGGACGPAACTVDVVGVRNDAGGEDLWRFSVDQARGSVKLLEGQAGAVPTDVASVLDERVRAAAPAELLDNMVLASVRWRPPPGAGEFDLSYRSGDEEGSCEVDVRLGPDGRQVEEVTSTNC